MRLQLVRLLFEVFECNASLAFQTSDFSNIITNSKSKECGPIQLSDINPDSSCTNGKFKKNLYFTNLTIKLSKEIKQSFFRVVDLAPCRIVNAHPDSLIIYPNYPYNLL